MTRRFADTSLFVAFLNSADEHHAEALEHVAHSRARIVTTLWVLVEVGNYVASSQRR
jgi:predicted nucleic acid-binding protein